MSFPFTRLPVELAHEIVRISAAPDYQVPTAKRPTSYATALSLASTSHALRRLTMPHLLHTIVLESTAQTLSFISSLSFQRRLDRRSPLALDYSKLVRQFWCSECWEDHGPDGELDYAALYKIIRGVDLLGLSFYALHLLYNALDSSEADPRRDWKCQKIIFTGANPRWNPLRISHSGVDWMGRITHLMFWIPPPVPSEEPTSVPHWVAEIPFSDFTSLTHMAFPPISNDLSVPVEMVAHVAKGSDFTPAVFREWATSRKHGVVIPFQSPPICRVGEAQVRWEVPFVMGEASRIWAEADRLTKDA
ncbi:hypothetical protein FB45DRAFT_205171 [Roridomyces roridus]|uniref:Uncharacterized protein n=1 Tax=Roridomyces roridus TaxID=1738132 RepID=A0AAD7FZH4_9AGAR|nr:hypothetical protein FB45DRAFT_205171 [Roridomyces roridus]